jgi:hypothetical protein
VSVSRLLLHLLTEDLNNIREVWTCRRSSIDVGVRRAGRRFHAQVTYFGYENGHCGTHTGDEIQWRRARSAGRVETKKKEKG